MTKVPFSEQDFQLWRHHPVSEVFLQYLRDYAGVLEREMMDRWKSGAVRLIDEQEARGRVVACIEVADLPYESIREFYEGEKTENAV